MKNVPLHSTFSIIHFQLATRHDRDRADSGEAEIHQELLKQLFHRTITLKPHPETSFTTTPRHRHRGQVRRSRRCALQERQSSLADGGQSAQGHRNMQDLSSSAGELYQNRKRSGVRNRSANQGAGTHSPAAAQVFRSQAFRMAAKGPVPGSVRHTAERHVKIPSVSLSSCRCNIWQ